MRGKLGTRSRLHLWAALATSCAAIGPTASSGQNSTPTPDAGLADATSGGACVPGLSVACAGPQSCAGFQVCNQQGTGFDPCVCGSEASTGSPSGSSGGGSGDSAGSASGSGASGATTGAASSGSGASGASGVIADGGMSGALCTTPCAVGDMLCAGRCASQSDPTYGCGSASCQRCLLPQARPSCNGGGCAVAACEPGWADQDGDPANGCETDLSAPATCTTALLSCTGTNNLCSPTGCVASCTPPLTQCGSRCIDLTQSLANCGQCGHSCSAPSGGFPTCSPQGICGTPACFPGLTACSGSCVDLSNDGQNCGSCGNACPAATSAASPCSDGRCNAVCQPGWALCGSACVTTQTDPANCGACAHACGSTDICVTGSCTTATSIWLTTGLSSPYALTTDTSNVYFTDIGTGNVGSIAKGGGPVTTLATGQSKPVSIAVDDAYVYWSNNLGGAVVRTLKAGGDTVHTVATATTPTDIAIDATYVYFLETGSGDVMRAPKGGGAMPTIFASPPLQSSFDAMVSDGMTLYATGPSGAIGESVWTIDLGTAAEMKLSGTGELHGERVQAVGSTWYGAASLTGPMGAIEWINKATNEGGSISTGPFVANALGIGACGFVWGGVGLNLSLPGSAFASVLDSTAMPIAIVVDGDVVYWTDASAIGALALP